MALWLVAVIVLIAVGVMPSTARAHAGSHDGVRSGHMESSRAAVSAHDTRKVAETGLRIEASAAFATLCDGTCCQAGCRTGACCCTGAGLAPEADALGDAPRPRARALAWAASARTDIIPEALPEPPRSHA